MEKLTHTVTGIRGGILLGDYLRLRLGFSSSLIRRVKYGGILLGGEAVTVRAALREGDEITVLLPEERGTRIEPIPLPLTVLYEDDCLLAVDKPTDMPVHPSRGNHLPTLGAAVAHYMGRPFVLHAINRLDRDTSGIVIVAKDAYAAERLGYFMKERRFQKVYEAILVGMPSSPRGRIVAPIDRESPDSIRRTVRAGGKEAITDYEVIGETAEGNAVCRLILHTGRTHQIRVHMAHIGHPLYSDFLYGEQIGEECYRLHCSEITFPHPLTEEAVTVRSVPPFATGVFLKKEGQNP